MIDNQIQTIVDEIKETYEGYEIVDCGSEEEAKLSLIIAERKRGR